ncbi:helix-turn-helix domain-containing protein [Sporosarcina sp. CAU 1771]
MEKKGVNEKLMSTNEFINEIERARSYDRIENFFTMETQLLDSLFNQEKEKTQEILRSILASISKYDQSERLLGVKNYFIILSSLVARRMEKTLLTPRKAFAFNNTCILLVERKLSADNVLEIADELIEFYTYVLTERKSPLLKHTTVNKVIRYINEEVESPLTVEAIAKRFDVSTSHLSRIFREHAKITLVEYINIRKVEESQYYLRFSEKRIEDISNQFHFCNQSYFTRIFKKYTGETPKKFRNNLSGEYFHYSLTE